VLLPRGSIARRWLREMSASSALLPIGICLRPRKNSFGGQVVALLYAQDLVRWFCSYVVLPSAWRNLVGFGGRGRRGRRTTAHIDAMMRLFWWYLLVPWRLLSLSPPYRAPAPVPRCFRLNPVPRKQWQLRPHDGAPGSSSTSCALIYALSCTVLPC
jgi:hypothetical protein